MADPYASYSMTAESLGRKSRPVIPGAADIDPLPKAVVCGTAGNITVVPAGNDNAVSVTFTNIPAGFVPPFVVRRVLSGTTANVFTIED